MRRLLLTINILAVGLFVSPLALADSVQMLPPTVSGTSTVCSGGSTVLAYTGDPAPGHSGINCVPVIIDSVGNVTTNSGNVGIGTDSPNSSLDLSHRTDAIGLPVGNSAQRPASPVIGMARYNTDITNIEYWDGVIWKVLGLRRPCSTSPLPPMAWPLMRDFTILGGVTVPIPASVQDGYTFSADFQIDGCSYTTVQFQCQDGTLVPVTSSMHGASCGGAPD